MSTGVGYLLLTLKYNNSWLILASQLIIFSCFLVIFVADFKYTIIPDAMIIVAFLASLMMLFAPESININFYNRLSSAVGAGLVFLFIWSITQGRGMGFGDVKLVFVLGFILGFPAVAVSLYLAFLTGTVAGVILIAIGKKSVKSKIPFGPFLILGFWLTQVWGDQVIKYWMKFII